MDFLVRFTQSHETFRLPELQSLADLHSIPLTVKSYRASSPFCLVTLPSPTAASTLASRAILVQSIYEHWATAPTLPALHASVRASGKHTAPEYRTASFKFTFDSFQGTRPQPARLPIINSFAYLGFQGPIDLKNPEHEFTVLEEWKLGATLRGDPEPEALHFGRLAGIGARDLATTYTLKTRRYISTTSMDSELALVTANIALASPGKLFYDPFVGTGSFPVAAAHFGALAFGSDIDGRSIRGAGKEGGGVKGNFAQYGLGGLLGGMFVADLTNSPVRVGRIWDGIVCDPPYGVREGLKVLGSRDPERVAQSDEAKARSRLPDYIPPKKPYSFLMMLDDIVAFAAATLVDGGRLAFWMPTSNEEAEEIPPPEHPCLRIVTVCSQDFNKWSRKLIAYKRIADAEVDESAVRAWLARSVPRGEGTTANELNPFRKMYFTSTKVES